MFYRYLEPDHPANEGKDTVIYKDVIPELYGNMDAFLGEVLQKLGDDDDTVLMVISDHGFTSFRRGVNLNSWLRVTDSSSTPRLSSTTMRRPIASRSAGPAGSPRTS